MQRTAYGVRCCLEGIREDSGGIIIESCRRAAVVVYRVVALQVPGAGVVHHRSIFLEETRAVPARREGNGSRRVQRAKVENHGARIGEGNRARGVRCSAYANDSY